MQNRYLLDYFWKLYREDYLGVSGPYTEGLNFMLVISEKT